MIKRFPFLHQDTSASCGLASAFSCAVHWLGKKCPWNHEEDMPIDLDEDGAEPDQLAEALTSIGLQATVHEDCTEEDLRMWSDTNTPVILGIQAWPSNGPVDWSESDEGHYAVFCGIDTIDGEEVAVFTDPAIVSTGPGPNGFIPLSDLTERWRLPVNGKDVNGLAIPVIGDKPAKLPTIERIR